MTRTTTLAAARRGGFWTFAALATVLSALPAHADVTVGKTFLNASTFVQGVVEQPIGLVNQGDIVVLAVSALNNGALITGGSVTDNLPAGILIAANPNPLFSAGCSAPTPAAGRRGELRLLRGSDTRGGRSGLGPVRGLCLRAGHRPDRHRARIRGDAEQHHPRRRLQRHAGGIAGRQFAAGHPIHLRDAVERPDGREELRADHRAHGRDQRGVDRGRQSQRELLGRCLGLADSLPAGLTATSANAQWVCSAGGSPTSATAVTGSGTTGLVSFPLPAGSRIAAGGSCTLSWSVIANTTDDDGQTYTNTVPANSVANDRGLHSAAGTANLVVQSPLAIAKSFAPATVPATSTFNLTLTLTNRSAFTLGNLSVVDPLPAAGGGQMTIAAAPTLSAGCASFTFTGAIGASSLQLTGTSLTAAQICQVTLPVTVSANGTYDNTTQAPSYTSANPAITGTHTILPASATVTAYTELTAKKSARDPRNTANAAGNVAPDNALAYVLTLSNYSTAALANVAITDPLPTASGAQVTFAASPAPAFTGCGAATTTSNTGDSTAVFSGIGIAAAVGDTPSVCTITFFVKVPANWPVGTAIGNTIPVANFTSGGTQILQGTAPAASSPTENRLVAAKATAPATVYQGQTALATITLTNNDYTDDTAVSVNDTPVYGATVANEVVLADQPSATTTCAGTPSFTAVAGSTSFQASGLTVPQRSSCTVSYYVKAVVPGAHVNTLPAANVTARGADGGTVSPVAAATSTLTVLSAINATKSFAPASIAASGGGARVTITLSNASSAQLTSVSVSDPLPTGLVLAGAPTASTSCAGTPSITAVPGAANASLTGATIAASSSCLFQFDVTTNGAGGNPIVNTIPVGGISAAGGLSNATAVSGSLGTFAAPSVSVQKSFSPASLTMVGAPSALTITLSNNQPGAVALSNLSITDHLPAGIVVLPGAASTTTCPAGVVTTPDTSTVSLSNATLAAGATCSITTSTTLKAQGSSTNTIPVGAVHDDQNVSNATAFSSNLSSLPSLGVNKFFTPPTVAPGVVSTLTIQLLNSQTFAITNVAMRDALPSGLNVASPSGATTSCQGGALSTAGNVIVLSGGMIPAAAGGATSCTINVNVVASAAGQYLNTINAGDVTGTAPDGSTTANLQAATATLHVLSAATVSKSFAQPNTNIGAADRLTITIANPNAVALNNAVLADTLPSGASLSATPNPSTTCPASTGSTVAVTPLPGPGGNIVQLTGAQIPAASSCSFAVDVLSNAVGAYNNVIPGNALRTDEGVTNTAAASATFSTLSPPTLGKQFDPVQIAPGGQTDLRIVLGNPNSVAITTTAALTDPLPQSPGPLTVTGLDLATTDLLPRCANASFTATTVVVASGTSIPANGCVVLATITGTVAGTYTNVLPGSALTTNAGASQIAATANLSISATLVAITGSVFTYTNATGQFDAAATPLPAQSVQLLDSTGTTVLATTTTTSLGGYAFVGLAPGTYVVREPAQPAGTLNGITTAGTVGGSTVGTATPVSITPSAISGIALAAGQVGSGYNFGEVQPSSVAGTVFSDTNNDGIQESGESGIAGESIALTGTDATGAAVSLTTSSAADGSYGFSGLRPGHYTLTEGPQPAQTSDGITTAGPVHVTGSNSTAPGSTPGTASAVGVFVNPPGQTSRIALIGLPANASSAGNNFARCRRATMSGTIFLDNNGDGTENGADAGIAGLAVQLVRGGTTIATSTTLADGSYSFVNLAGGAATPSRTVRRAPQPISCRAGRSRAPPAAPAVRRRRPRCR